MDIQVLIGLLISITLGLIAIVYWIHRNEIAASKEKIEGLEKRVQRIEDVQGNTIQGLKEDVKQLTKKVDTLTEKVNILAANVHNKKNIDGQLSQTLNLILRKLNEEHEAKQ